MGKRRAAAAKRRSNVGRTQVNSSVDVYAFGIIMWELLTGQRPYGRMKQHKVREHSFESQGGPIAGFHVRKQSERSRPFICC